MRTILRWVGLLSVAGCICVPTVTCAQSDLQDDYTVLTHRLAVFKRFAMIASGNVGVDPVGGQLLISTRMITANGSHLVSDFVQVGRGSSVFSVFANTYVSKGTVVIRAPGGSGAIPFAPPVLPVFPAAGVTAAAGTTNVLVKRETVVTLSPGAYDTIKVAARGTLVLTGGTYTCRELRVGRGARLLFTYATTLNVVDTGSFGLSSVVGPIGPTITADDVLINVAGSSVRVGRRATIAARLRAPGAAVWFSGEVHVKGQVVADEVHFANSAFVQSSHPVVGIFGRRTSTPTQTAPPTMTPMPTNTPPPTDTPTSPPVDTATAPPVDTATAPPVDTATVTPADTPTTAANTATPTDTATNVPLQTPTDTATPMVAVCGDGLREGGEECDDGNTANDDGCSAECRIEHDVIVGAQFCSLTQGAWGASNGAANGAHGLLTQHPDILPITIGGTGQSVSVYSQDALIAYLPTGGPPHALNAGDLDFHTPEDVVDDGAGVLSGQTVALSLSVALSADLSFGDLGALVLPTGSFCTQGLTAGVDGILGTVDDQLDPQSAISGPFTLPADITVVNNSVSDLLAMANQYLRGGSATVTVSEVNDAVTTINEAFDGCRRVVTCP